VHLFVQRWHRQDDNALFKQRFNLVACGCATDIARLGFAVMDTTGLLGQALADVLGVVSEFGKNRTLSERLATRDAIVKHFVIYGILLKLA